MPALQNNRHELFAQALFKGMPQVQAYIEAGFSPNGASGASTKLLQGNASIGQRVAELQERKANRAVWSKVDVLNKLAALHDQFAANEDPASGSVARATLMDYAKLEGMIIDKSITADATIDDLLKSIATTKD